MYMLENKRKNIFKNLKALEWRRLQPASVNNKLLTTNESNNIPKLTLCGY